MRQTFNLQAQVRILLSSLTWLVVKQAKQTLLAWLV